MTKIYIPYKLKNQEFYQTIFSLNFIKNFSCNKFEVEIIDIKEQKKELKNILQNKDIDLDDIKGILVFNENEEEQKVFFFCKEIIDFFINSFISSPKETEFDAVIIGSGIASLSSYYEIKKTKKRVLIIDNKNFGRSLIDDGINIDNPFIKEIFSPLILENFVEKTLIEAFIHESISDIKISKIDNQYCLNISELFNIITKNIIIGDSFLPKKLNLENENLAIYNIADDYESLINKKVVVIGDDDICHKLKIIQKVAKKVTHISLKTDEIIPLKIFEKDGETSAVLIKHKQGYTKPIKCEKIVYSLGYCKDETLKIDFDFDKTKETSIVEINCCSDNLIDLTYFGKKAVKSLLF